MGPRPSLGLVFALALAAWLTLPGAAGARRPATASERTAIAAAIHLKDSRDQLSGLAAHWAEELSCNKMLVYVSTVEPHWAALWFQSKYFRSKPPQDPRYTKCVSKGGEVDGTWVAKRTSAGHWVGTGWIWGDTEGFCEELKATGIPAAAFKDVDLFKRSC